MRVKQLADKYQVNLDTVRYYTRIGLLVPAKNPSNGYKEYTPEDERRLGFIIQAKSLGFSLQEIELFIAQSQQGKAPCPQVRALLKQHIAEVEQKINAMQATHRKMKKALAIWQNEPDCAPTGEQVCHLIEQFSDPGNSHE